MNKNIYVYCNPSLKDFFTNIFLDYKTTIFPINDFVDSALKNKNILLILDDVIISNKNNPIYLQNNIVVFSLNKKNKVYESLHPNVNFLYGPLHIKKFLDFIKNCFMLSVITIKDVEIVGEKMINLNTKSSCSITTLEKKILLELFELTTMNRDYFLENVLGIKKNIETKTIESHLTRIRKKLLQINSTIQISSKEDNFFLDY